MLPPDKSEVPQIKLIIIGTSGVGKSSLLVRYCDDTFDEGDTTTIGVDLKMKTLEVHGKPYKLRLWDTAGQERYRTITNSYYRGAHGIFIVYDVCNKDTFDSLPKWIEETEIHSNATQPVVRYIVGNKIDEKELRVVSTQQALDFIESIQPLDSNKRTESKEQPKSQPFYKEYAKTNGSSTDTSSPVTPQPSTRNKPLIDGYFEVSAKNTDGVRNMFVSMVEQIVDSGVLDPPLKPQTSRIANYSSWSVPSLVDLSYNFTKPVEKCYSTSC